MALTTGTPRPAVNTAGEGARGVYPAHLVSAIRRTVRRAAAEGIGPQHTAGRVAGQLRQNLPGPEILSPAQLRGDPAGYRTHVVHAEPDGSFSIAAMVWLPGQVTAVHDHVSWCVTGVLQGIEHEEIFALGPDGTFLTEAARRQNPPGAVGGFAPPGDIHRVCNVGDGVAVSMHIYGADLVRLGSSIRRVYHLPVRPLR